MRIYNKKFIRENPGISSDIEKLKLILYSTRFIDPRIIKLKASDTFEKEAVANWVKYKHHSVYVLKKSGSVSRYGIERIEVIPHELDYMSQWVANLKLWCKKAGEFEVNCVNFFYNGPARPLEKPFILFVSENNRPARFSADYIYKENELDSVYTVYQTIEYGKLENGRISGNLIKNLYLNVNGQGKLISNNCIWFGEIEDHPFYIWYTTKSKTLNIDYLYILNLQTGDSRLQFVVERDNSSSTTINSKNLILRRKFTQLLCEKSLVDTSLSMYVSQSESIQFQVLLHYLQKKKIPFSQIDSIAKNDFSVNYLIKVSPTDTKTIAFVLYLLRFHNLSTCKVFGVRLDILFSYILNGYELESTLVELGEPPGVNYLITNNIFKNGPKAVSEKLQMLIDRYRLLECLEAPQTRYYYRRGFRHCLPESHIYVLNLGRYSPNPSMEHLFNETRNELLVSGCYLPRWISEYELYRILLLYFPDAVFQYKTEWLESQSIDIFLPSFDTAIEYQGMQHYQPVDFFGGEEGYRDVVRRDKRKRILCKEKQIRLIYWPYYREINEKNISLLLQDIGFSL